MVAKFLSRLWSEYENVRAPILTRSKVPSFYEVYSRIQKKLINYSFVSSNKKSALISPGREESIRGHGGRSFMAMVADVIFFTSRDKGALEK